MLQKDENAQLANIVSVSKDGLALWSFQREEKQVVANTFKI